MEKLITKMRENACLHKTFCVDVSGTKLTSLEAIEEVCCLCFGVETFSDTLWLQIEISNPIVLPLLQRQINTLKKTAIRF